VLRKQISVLGNKGMEFVSLRISSLLCTFWLNAIMNAHHIAVVTGMSVLFLFFLIAAECTSSTMTAFFFLCKEPRLGSPPRRIAAEDNPYTDAVGRMLGMYGLPVVSLHAVARGDVGSGDPPPAELGRYWTADLLQLNEGGHRCARARFCRVYQLPQPKWFRV
jgi:hypothetical protein